MLKPNIAVSFAIALQATLICGQESELQELRLAVAENEQLFSNMAATYRVQRNTAPALIEAAANKSGIVAASTGTVTGLWCEEKYSAKNVRVDTHGDDTAQRRVQIQAYDGSLTRINHYAQVGNIVKDKVREYSLKPACFGMPRLGLSAPLSELLTFDSQDKRPYLSTIERWNRVHYEFVGDENIDNLKCIKIDLFVFLDQTDEAPSEKHSFWVAPSRNYLVATSKSFNLRVNDTSPYLIATVTGWTEIESGTWVPSKANYRHYTFDDPGKPSLLIEQTFELESCSLDVDPDDGRFSNVEFQKGREVHIVEDGKIVDTIIDGIPVERDRN